MGHLIVQRGNNVRDPPSRPLARRQEHFHLYFLVFHFFGQTLHKLTARVNLQNLRRSQRAALVNRLESLRNFGRVFRGQRLGFYVTAADVDNGHRVFANFSATGQLLVWQKKKVRLMERVRCRYVEFRAGNVARGKEIDLPKSLFGKPLLGRFFRDFRRFR